MTLSLYDLEMLFSSRFYQEESHNLGGSLGEHPHERFLIEIHNSLLLLLVLNPRQPWHLAVFLMVHPYQECC